MRDNFDVISQKREGAQTVRFFALFQKTPSESGTLSPLVNAHDARGLKRNNFTPDDGVENTRCDELPRVAESV